MLGEVQRGNRGSIMILTLLAVSAIPYRVLAHFTVIPVCNQVPGKVVTSIQLSFRTQHPPLVGEGRRCRSSRLETVRTVM